jgi:MFS family permease
MSTLTHPPAAPAAPAPAPATTTAPAAAAPPKLVSGPLAATFLAEFSSLTSFFLLFSVLPMLAAPAGGSSGAGLVTGALLLGTVAAEAAAPAAIGRLGGRAVLAAGAALLGLPALALLASHSPAVMLAVSLVRGFGFGLCGVTGGAIAARLLPPDRRGEGLGLLGIVTGIPAVAALPAGIWLAGQGLAPVAAVLAAAFGLVPLAVLRWLPGGKLGGGSAGRPAAAAGRVPGPRRPWWLRGPAPRLALVFAAATVAAGVLDAFLPLIKGIPSVLVSAALLVQALVATITRWQAGKRGDRYGHARLLTPALAVAAAGMAAMIAAGSPALLLAGSALFGAGFGVIENATLAQLIERLPETRASALWNLAYDAGYGAGPAAFGLVCVHTGYPATFALAGALIVAVVPLALRDRRGR